MGDAPAEESQTPSTSTLANAAAASTTEAPHVGDQYEVPAYEPHSSFETLKERIRHHYELASDHYYALWGQHIHHAYFLHPGDSKETGQVNLINLLLDVSQLGANSTVLDVGCGIGGTTRHLARELGCTVTGITISGRQVQIARRLTEGDDDNNNNNKNKDDDKAGAPGPVSPAPPSQPSLDDDDDDDDDFTPVGSQGGKVRYLELDAEKMGAHFAAASFDGVWISEALSHFPSKALFFRNAARVLRQGGKLVVADWFRAPFLTAAQVERDIRPIEDGMLLPPLCTPAEYVDMACAAGLKVAHAPLDISDKVARTWDLSWELVRNPAVWAFAVTQGRDGLAFLQAFRAMRRGYRDGTFRYGVMAFEKP